MPDQSPLDNTPRVRRIIQTVCDLRRNQFAGSTVLDLGCAHGTYALEFARRGAKALGIEGRDEWLKIANRSLDANKGFDAQFVLGDARDLSVEKHGRFDIVLCLGLLYHLDAADAVKLLRSIHDVCTDFAIVDTQIAARPDREIEVDGHTYTGWAYREHEATATLETKATTMGASLDDEFSFWFSRPSLLNALRHAGFSSVFEVKNPMDNLFAHGEFKLHEDVVTLVAMKGQPISEFLGRPANMQAERDWPENTAQYHLKRPWSVD